MASAAQTKPTCPVCHQADQVKTTEAAYTSGVARSAPPDMPARQVSMFPYVAACVVLVGICVFFILVLIGSEGAFPLWLQATLLGLTILSILTALGISYYAFQRVVRGDQESTALLPAWDKAMAKWRTLYYCSRDDVVFDPATNAVVTDKQLAALRTFGEPSGTIQSVLASH